MNERCSRYAIFGQCILRGAEELKRVSQVSSVVQITQFPFVPLEISKSTTNSFGIAFILWRKIENPQKNSTFNIRKLNSPHKIHFPQEKKLEVLRVFLYRNILKTLEISAYQDKKSHMTQIEKEKERGREKPKCRHSYHQHTIS